MWKDPEKNIETIIISATREEIWKRNQEKISPWAAENGEDNSSHWVDTQCLFDLDI